MKKPILLTKKELVEPISQALERLKTIKQQKASNEDKIIIEGLFVLAVSSFENSLNDTLRVLIKHIPQKLDSKIDNISKEDLIEDNLLQKAINNKINSISYKNLKEIIDYFIKTTAIDDESLSNSLLDKLQEIKATRNLLLHNNLITNNIYLASAGKLARSRQLQKQLTFSNDYLFQSIETLIKILQIFHSQLQEKYKNYTKVNAIKKLFEFMFETPIMQFENEWKIDKERDFIHSYNKEKSKRAALSSGEEILFNIWLSHIQGDGIIIRKNNFYRLGSKSRKKLAYLLTVIEILKPH